MRPSFSRTAASFALLAASTLCAVLAPATAVAQGALPALFLQGDQDGPPRSGPTLPPLLGVNKAPLFTRSGTSYEVAELYKAVGVNSVRTHDDVFDPCKVYVDDTVELNGTATSSCTPASTVSDAVLWYSNSSPPSGGFDYSQVDPAITAINKASAHIYLRVGESWNGADQVDSAADYAEVAASLASHVDGLGSIEFAEVWNEPDGRFWEETTGPTAFYDLYDAIVTTATTPLGLPTGGAGFTHGGMQHLSTTAIAKDWDTQANPAGQDFISGHYYGACNTGGSNELDLVTWLDDVTGQIGALQHQVPLHVTEWNLDTPSSGCSLFAQSTHGSFTAAALILMSSSEFEIERSHFYGGIGNSAHALFSPNGANVDVNPASFGYWGYKSLASKVRVNTTQSWGSGSGTAADAARAGERWFGVAGAGAFGGTFVLITNDDSSAMNLRVVTSWHPVNPATIRQKSGMTPFTVLAPPAGSTRTVSAGAAAAAFNVGSTSQAWTVSGSTSEMTIALPAYSITTMQF